MRSWILPALLGIVSSGCVAPQVTPDEAFLRSVRTVVVVPVESPPLVLHPSSEEQKSAIAALMASAESRVAAAAPEPSGPGASVGRSAAPFVLAPPAALRTGAAALAGIGGMMMLLEAYSSGRQAPTETASVVSGQPSEKWVPSVELARQAVPLLKQKDFLEVGLIDGYLRLPIVDRSTTWHLENWLAPIRDWYNSDLSTVDYAKLGFGKAQLVLEVGVSNYEYAFDRLILQVWVRLVEPETRRVLGRARSAESSKPQPLEPLLRNDAQGMKRLVLETGNRLLAKCLADVGFAAK